MLRDSRERKLWVAFVTLLLVLPHSFAISLGEYNQKTAEDTARVQPAFDKLTGSLDKDGPVPSDSEIQKQLESLKKTIKWTKKERELLDKIDFWVNKKKLGIGVKSLLDLAEAKKVEALEKKVKDSEKTLAQLKNRAASSPFGSELFDATEASCKSGADELDRRAKNLEDKIQSDPMKEFRKDILANKKEDEKKLKEDKEKAKQKRTAAFKALFQKDPTAEEAKALREGNEKTPSKDLTSHLLREAKYEQIIKEEKDAAMKIQESIGLALINFQDERDKEESTASDTAETTSKISATLKKNLQDSFGMLGKSLDVLYENCVKNKKMAGTNENAGLIGKANEWDKAYAMRFHASASNPSRNPLDFYHNPTFVPMLQKIASNVKCTKVNKNELNEIARPLFDSIAQFESARDLNNAGKQLVGIMDSIPGVFQAIRKASSISDLKQECNNNAATIKKMKDFIGMMQSEMGNGSEGGASAGNTATASVAPAAGSSNQSLSRGNRGSRRHN